MELAEFYKKVFAACVRTAVYGRHEMKTLVREWTPDLSELTNGIQKGSLCAAGYERGELCSQWNLILTDLLEGMEQEDEVFLEDTVEFGLKEFLEYFFTEKELERLRKESQDEQGNL